MSIASQLTALEGNISNAYDMVAQRGGTVPTRKNMENLDDAIATIPSGGGGGIVVPKEVNQNGELGPKTSAPYTFSASTATWIPMYSLAAAFSNYKSVIDYSGGSITELDLRNVERVGDYALRYACVGCHNLTTIRLDKLKYGNAAYAFEYAFMDCPGLIGTINLDALDTSATGAGFFNYAFSSCTGLTGMSMNNIATISGQSWMRWMFYKCSNLASASMDNLTTISGTDALSCAFRETKLTTSGFLKKLTTVSGSGACNCLFSGCTSLTTASLPKLTTVSGSSALGNIFSGCTALTTVDLPLLSSLSTASQAMERSFQECTSLTTASFPALATVKGQYALRRLFRNCTSLTTVSFPALTTASFGSYTNTFNAMLEGCSGVTVHFPAAIQSKIGGWTDVTNGFGGTNTTVLFDL